jgi:predicted RNase H-like HicB family nuclease
MRFVLRGAAEFGEAGGDVLGGHVELPGDLVAGEAGGVEVGDGAALRLARGEVAEAARLAFVRGTMTTMRAFTAVIERDPETGLLVGYVPGFPGAHSQGSSMEELQRNLREVIGMLLEDGEPKLDGEFVGTQLVTVD